MFGSNEFETLVGHLAEVPTLASDKQGINVKVVLNLGAQPFQRKSQYYLKINIRATLYKILLKFVDVALFIAI